MTFWKKLAYYASAAVIGLAVGFGPIGCDGPQQPPRQALKYVYEVIWVQGTHEHPNYGVTLNRYYTDEIKCEGPWLIFVDKQNGVKTRLAATNVVVYGGE